MFLHNRSITCAFLMTIGLAGCKSMNDGSRVREEMDPEAKTESADRKGRPRLKDCGDASANAKDLNGEETFELTSNCIFSDKVHELRIRIFSETFQKVLDDGCKDKDTGFGHVLEFVLDGKRIENVGIKVRGNTSRCNPKRQFKFKFNVKKAFSVFAGKETLEEFPENDDRTFFGLEGISVRTSGNDPSMMRETVSSKLFAEAEALAPTAERGGLVYRTGFTKFYVSFNRTVKEGPEGTANRPMGEYFYDYKGFYDLSENIDKVFMQTRFQVGDAKLKGFYIVQADKADASFERDTYKRVGWSADYCDGKSADDEATLKKCEDKLFELMDVLAKKPSDQDLDSLVDVDNVVNYVASAILAGHWDSMLANKNNDILYFNGNKNQWQIITWDLDNTQGALVDQYHLLMSPDIFAPAIKHKSRLFEEIFSDRHPAFREKLKRRMRDFLSGFASDAKFDKMVEDLKSVVRANTEGWENFSSGAADDIKKFARARREEIKPQVR